jgi:hypothetical protein
MSIIFSLQYHGVGGRINRCCDEKDIWHVVRFFYEISKSCGAERRHIFMRNILVIIMIEVKISMEKGSDT